MSSQEIIQLWLSPLISLSWCSRVQWTIIVGQTPITWVRAVVDIRWQVVDLGLNTVAVTPPAVRVSGGIVTSERQISIGIGGADRGSWNLCPINSSNCGLDFSAVGRRDFPNRWVIGGAESDSRKSAGRNSST